MMNVEKKVEPMGAVAVRDHQPPAQSDGGALISVIERVALNPHVDVDKLERLLVMQQTIMTQNAKVAFATAMKNAQADMRPVVRDANNPQTKSKYASYAALDNAIRPIYTRNGFSPTFDTGDGAPELHVRVVCDLMHEEGHSRPYHIDIPADGKGAKGGDVMTKTHATVSAVSYGKRALLGMIFNIATFDDDGNAAGSASGFIKPDQVEKIKQKADGFDSDTLAGFLKYVGTESIETIPAAAYDKAIYALGLKKGQTK